MDFNKISATYHQPLLSGRYITLDQVEPILAALPSSFSVIICGHSVAGRPLYSVTVGTGPKRILLWSQMHGNESTATKALADLLEFFRSDCYEAQQILKQNTLCIIPMLNPDGANLYTRANAAEVDLNRDMMVESQPETKTLKSIFENFAPDYCYNLHDQRTIFGAGDSGKPASISLLAPAYNDQREWNDSRIASAALVNSINAAVQCIAPGHVGRFDDTYNINCAGDYFQTQGVPTVLIEAGHYPNDYHREHVRKLFLTALLAGLADNYENVIADDVLAEYLKIPINKTNFHDFVYRNVRINYDGNKIITNFASQYTENVINNKIVFNAFIVNIGDLSGFHGHYEFDAKGQDFHSIVSDQPLIGEKADFNIGNFQFINGVPQ